MNTHKSTRRSFLKGVGVTMALPLFQRDLELRAANSIGQSDPMRMVCIANPLGFVPDSFFPKENGSLKHLPTLLQPLSGLRDQFSVFSGLDHGLSGGHSSVHSFLSGIRDNDSAQFESRNITMDQRAAELVRGETRFPSLVSRYCSIEEAIR